MNHHSFLSGTSSKIKLYAKLNIFHTGALLKLIIIKQKIIFLSLIKKISMNNDFDVKTDEIDEWKKVWSHVLSKLRL